MKIGDSNNDSFERLLESPRIGGKSSSTPKL